MWFNDECLQIKVLFNVIPSGGYSPSTDCPSSYWKCIGKEVAYWSKVDWQMIFEYVSPQDVETLSKE